MTTTVVQNTVVDPAGNPRVGLRVDIALASGAAPGLTSTSSIESVTTVYTDASGNWTATLRPNAEITSPTGTYYEVREGGARSTIVVPVGGGPYELSAVLTGTQPAAPVVANTFGIEHAGTLVASRQALNLIEGTNVQFTVADNPAAGRVDVTVTSTAGGAGPSATVVTEQAFGQAATAGVSAAYSRGDHTHGTMAAPAGTTPSGTVTDERPYGITPNAGVSSNYSRGDHTHGTPTAPVAPALVYPFSKAGAVAVATGAARLYNDTGRTLTISAVRASVGTAPTGTSLIVDVKKNGTTIFTTQANRPTIAISGNTSGKVTNMDVTTLADGDYLTVDVAQVGSTVAGSDLTVTVYAS